MTTDSAKEKIQESNQNQIIILSGGGADIERVLKNIASTGIFQDKSVAYVAIAAETDEKLLTLITSNFDKLKHTFWALGVTDADLITSTEYSDMFKHDLIILSGGNTAYLLDTLRKKNFAQKIKEHPNIEAIIGISAGAIVLAQSGIGTMNGRRHRYQGLGLISDMVIPHSDFKLQKQYSNALHLKEYESHQYN
jgi:peptidase E